MLDQDTIGVDHQWPDYLSLVKLGSYVYFFDMVRMNLKYLVMTGA